MITFNITIEEWFSIIFIIRFLNTSNNTDIIDKLVAEAGLLLHTGQSTFSLREQDQQSLFIISDTNDDAALVPEDTKNELNLFLNIKLLEDETMCKT